MPNDFDCYARCQELYREKQFWRNQALAYKNKLRDVQAAFLVLDKTFPEEVAYLEAKYNFDCKNLVGK